MAQIEIAYRLIPDTLLYGQFIVDMFTLDPKATIVKNYEYEWVKDTQAYVVTMDAEVAILQKLKYGDCLAGAKKPKPTPEDKEEMEKEKFKLIKYKKNIWDIEDDYSWIMKEKIRSFEHAELEKMKQELSKEYSMQMIKKRPRQENDEGYYFDLKSISRLFDKDV